MTTSSRTKDTAVSNEATSAGTGTSRVKRGMAEMLKGGVIMDVVNAEQARIAKAYVAQLEAAKAYARPIATRIEPGAAFYPAEGYHQDFMAQHPGHPYIAVNDAPKLEALKQLFPERTAPQPVLVNRPPA